MRHGAFILLACTSLVIQAEVVSNDGDFGLSTDFSPPFSDCDVAPMARADDCPARLKIAGFNVYVSPFLDRDWGPAPCPPVSGPCAAENRLTIQRLWATLDHLDSALRMLDLVSVEYHYAPSMPQYLRERGVSFYIAPTNDRYVVDGAVDWRAPCPGLAACYRATDRLIQLWMVSRFQYFANTVVHELAHAWTHLMVNGDAWNNQCINDAYRFSIERDGKYLNMEERGTVYPHRYGTGRFSDAYAATNVAEYFAELATVWYLGGDFVANQLPASRAELLEYDRNGYFLMYELMDAEVVDRKLRDYGELDCREYLPQ